MVMTFFISACLHELVMVVVTKKIRFVFLFIPFGSDERLIHICLLRMYLFALQVRTLRAEMCRYSNTGVLNSSSRSR